MTWEWLIILGVIIIAAIFLLSIFRFVMKVTFFAAAVLIVLKLIGVL